MELVSALAAETGQNPGESELAAYSGSFFILFRVAANVSGIVARTGRTATVASGRKIAKYSVLKC